ncbi:MAG: hypothetical protein ABIS27_05345 [Longimicrobiales bacterium]
MQVRKFVVLGLALGLAACSQDGQELPTSWNLTTGSQSVTSAGATLSLPGAGVTLNVPAGAVSAGTTLTATTTAAPAGVSTFGTAASSGFALTPDGQVLSTPATVDIRLNASAAADPNAWLASIVLVSGGKSTLLSSEVDLTRRVVSADISRLGTVVAILPNPASVSNIGPITGSLFEAAVMTAGNMANVSSAPLTYRGPCTDSSFSSCTVLDGTLNDGLSASASANILSKFAQAATVGATINGTITADPVTKVVSGSADAHITIYAQLLSRANTVNIIGDALIPQFSKVATTVTTATTITYTITGLSVTVTSSEGKTATEVVTATFTTTLSGIGPATLVFQRSIDLGNSETGTVRFAISFKNP